MEQLVELLSTMHYYYLFIVCILYIKSNRKFKVEMSMRNFWDSFYNILSFLIEGR